MVMAGVVRGVFILKCVCSRCPQTSRHIYTKQVIYHSLPLTNSSVLTVKVSRCNSTRSEVSSEVKKHDSVLSEVLSKEEPQQLTIGAKAVQAGKDFTYLIAIITGFGVAGLLFYYVGSEFFSSSSPSSIFTKALKRVKADPKLQQVLGDNISGYGEHASRRRRTNLNYLEYEVDGVTYMRMKFNVSGSKRKGETVLELKKNAGRYELRFLFVELTGYPPQTIVLEDNR